MACGMGAERDRWGVDEAARETRNKKRQEDKRLGGGARFSDAFCCAWAAESKMCSGGGYVREQAVTSAG
jgi:hypothetical protein